MNEEIKNQIQRIKIAKTRLNAEISVGRTMLPDHVDSEVHYNGKELAIRKYGEWEELINLVY